MLDKERIREAFSRAAPFYDSYAHVQMEAASSLIEGIREGDFSAILELGCGSGNYTLMLRSAFRQAHIMAVDFASGMLRVASAKLNGQGIRFILGDGEFPPVSERRFDLITSNLAFQWFDDLTEAIKGYRDLLKEGGMLHFSIFGQETFSELREVMRGLFPDIHLATDQFFKGDGLKAVLADSFRGVRIEETRLRRVYPDLKGLLETIRYTGGNGLARDLGLFFTPTRIRCLEEAYLERFGIIRANYEVFILTGIK